MSEWSELLGQTPLPWHQSQWQRLHKQRQASQLAHAYLLKGEEGLGKLLFAYRFAQFLLCLSPDKEMPCGQCRNCQAGGQDWHPDVLVVEVPEDKKIINVDQVRELTEFSQLTSLAGGARIVIINDADRMNRSAANALLKTLEEPHRDTYLFLISALPGYLSPTIRSRCQSLQFMVPSLELGARWVQSQLPEGEDPSAVLMAAGGRPLAALELALSGGVEGQREFLIKLAAVVLGAEPPETLAALAQKLGELRAVRYFSQSSTILMKGALRASDEALIPELRPLADPMEKLAARKTGQRRLMTLYQDAVDARRQLLSGSNPNPQLLLENLAWRWSRLLARS